MDTFLTELFERDLLKLKEELNKFTDESNIWKTANGVSNSAGNLTLHLIGNLNHFIGATLGNTGYIRTRDLEFSTKGTPRAQVLADIDKTIEVVVAVLNALTKENLESNFPIDLFGQKTTLFFLAHLYGHLSYHLGQINYLRRMLEGA